MPRIKIISLAFLSTDVTERKRSFDDADFERIKRMNSTQKSIPLTVLGIILMTSACPAQQTNAPSYVVVGGGVSGVLDKEKSIVGMVEFQPALRAGPFGTWIALQADDQEYYLGAGLLYDWYVTEHIFITPSFGAGVYGEHHGINLGSVLEFRSGIECGYDMKTAGRISIGFWHLSNAGLGNINPGTEIVAIRYAFPI